MSHAWRFCCTYDVNSDGSSSDHLTCDCGAQWWQGEDGEPLGPCDLEPMPVVQFVELPSGTFSNLPSVTPEELVRQIQADIRAMREWIARDDIEV